MDDDSRIVTKPQDIDVARLDELAGNVAAAVAKGGEIWVLAESGIAAAARAVVLLFQVGRRPLPASPVDPRSGRLPPRAKPGDVLLAFSQTGGCLVFECFLDEARARGLSLAVVPPELTSAFERRKLGVEGEGAIGGDRSPRQPSRASRIAACLELAGDLEELTQQRLPAAS